MKKLIKISILIVFFFALNPAYNQTDPPGMPGSYGSNDDQVPGGGAPIGGGLLILISMSAAYLVKRSDLSFSSNTDD